MKKSDRKQAKESGKRFARFIDHIAEAMGRGIDIVRDYCMGLMLDADGRKSMEPIAARTDPERTSAQHQAIQHFIAKTPWNDEDVLAKVREYVLPTITKHAPISAWIADDTGIPKSGEHSVGVAHQYCGQLGKQARCQVAVTLSVANEYSSLPIAYRLYLPEEWTNDIERRRKVGIPDDIAFATKPQIALAQVRQALDAGIPRGIFIGDAGYGNNTDLRDRLTQWNVPYAVTVQGTTNVWRPGSSPLPPKPWIGFGRKPKSLRRDPDHHPISVKQLASELPDNAWQTVEWREGTAGILSSRFAMLRVRAAHGETHMQRAEEWLLIEWPEGEKEPRKYWLSTLPESTTLQELVQTVQMRWRIERDFQELKGELGLNQFEGRNWRGFHHHATLCIAAYGFLVAERASFSPSTAATIKIASLSRCSQPRRASHRRRATQSAFLTILASPS
jgi:SRSO17 transposase